MLIVYVICFNSSRIDNSLIVLMTCIKSLEQEHSWAVESIRGITIKPMANHFFHPVTQIQ